MLDSEVARRILYNGYPPHTSVNGSSPWIFSSGHKNLTVLRGLKLEFYCSEGRPKTWRTAHRIDVLQTEQLLEAGWSAHIVYPIVNN